MAIPRIVLAPLAWLYGAALRVRHALYDAGLLNSIRPAVPTIAIGNLALGGTGKTPMLELLLRVLHGTMPIATLSRGYGRDGSDIHEVQATDAAERSGDEPVQVKRKFPEARVYVGADRLAAIQRIQRDAPQVQAVVLDDALQHRRLDAGLNILLTTCQRPWCDDALLPAGRLRDLPSRRKSAQVVVVTKCPALPSVQERKRWRERLQLSDGQELFFAGIEYDEPEPSEAVRQAQKAGAIGKASTHDPGPLPTAPASCLLFTGIADPQPLLDHLRKTATVEHLAFPDHHAFTRADLERIAQRYATFAPGPKSLVTTEKDAARLGSLKGTPLEGLPLATIGMRAVLLNEPERFAELIRRHAGPHQAHR
ncbi:MAG: tetraacyldisaccharide 4'-kinase [Flavobacteriales bacterium]|nr:tetraacyldisaccharide 4'-kinase [Flavobacteriales bacterium]